VTDPPIQEVVTPPIIFVVDAAALTADDDDEPVLVNCDIEEPISFVVTTEPVMSAAVMDDWLADLEVVEVDAAEPDPKDNRLLGLEPPVVDIGPLVDDCAPAVVDP
jgi:hypothetical protein